MDASKELRLFCWYDDRDVLQLVLGYTLEVRENAYMLVSSLNRL